MPKFITTLFTSFYIWFFQLFYYTHLLIFVFQPFYLLNFWGFLYVAFWKVLFFFYFFLYLRFLHYQSQKHASYHFQYYSDALPMQYFLNFLIASYSHFYADLFFFAKLCKFVQCSTYYSLNNWFCKQTLLCLLQAGHLYSENQFFRFINYKGWKKQYNYRLV